MLTNRTPPRIPCDFLYINIFCLIAVSDFVFFYSFRLYVNFDFSPIFRRHCFWPYTFFSARLKRVVINDLLQYSIVWTDNFNTIMLISSMHKRYLIVFLSFSLPPHL